MIIKSWCSRPGWWSPRHCWRCRTHSVDGPASRPSHRSEIRDPLTLSRSTTPSTVGEAAPGRDGVRRSGRSHHHAAASVSGRSCRGWRCVEPGPWTCARRVLRGPGAPTAHLVHWLRRPGGAGSPVWAGRRRRPDATTGVSNAAVTPRRSRPSAGPWPQSRSLCPRAEVTRSPASGRDVTVTKWRAMRAIAIHPTSTFQEPAADSTSLLLGGPPILFCWRIDGLLFGISLGHVSRETWPRSKRDAAGLPVASSALEFIALAALHPHGMDALVGERPTLRHEQGLAERTVTSRFSASGRADNNVYWGVRHRDRAPGQCARGARTLLRRADRSPPPGRETET